MKILQKLHLYYLKHEKEACMRRILLFTIFKNRFSLENMQISQLMTSYTQPNVDQI